jgi:hypothetical protein
VNPDADTQRVVWAEAFARRVAWLVARGSTREAAEVMVGVEHPHLACAAEQLRHPPERWREIQARWSA